MPKITNYTPPWLLRPSPGSNVFSDSTQSPASPSKRTSYVVGAAHNNNTSSSSDNHQGPRRLLAARRGTEIFTVVGNNQIRWADLSNIKDKWAWKRQEGKENKPSANAKKERGEEGEGDSEDNRTQHAQYMTLVTPVYYQIRQLAISPSGTFLAICTEHTVHVALLPDSSRLRDPDQSPLKVKTYQLGPTIHVIPESPVVSAIWHPLAAATSSSDCLVTVTAEAAVRVWELDATNQWSFASPALAIDLRKLADGVSCDGNFEPSGFGKSRGFSVDAFDMEVSAACFGGRANENEDAWASMTLWVAMRNGDVYALCPLLPSRWQPTATTIPSLSTSTVSKMASLGDADTDTEERTTASQQYEWVQEIDRNEPIEIEKDSENLEVRSRPTNPSAIPRLQGPFEIQMADNLVDLDVSDIYVIAASLDEDELMSGEDDYVDNLPDMSGGVPFTLVCLATTDGSVHIAMDVDGVSGQWLPKLGRNTFKLILVESVSISEQLDASVAWTMFTPGTTSRYEAFLTTPKQIFSLSLADWSSRLGMELSPPGDEDSGLEARVKATCQTRICVWEELISTEDEPSTIPNEVLSAPVVLEDPNIGYMLLSSTLLRAYAVTFDQPHLRTVDHGTSSPESLSSSRNRFDVEFQEDLTAEDMPEMDVRPRAPYTPHIVFYQPPTAPMKDFLTMNVPPRTKQTLKQAIKLSPATLDIMTSAHRILSSQTSQLEKAAAELFRRCERLREELADQIKQMTELAARLQNIGGQSGDPSAGKPGCDDRLVRAQDRQKELIQRYETLRRKISRTGSSNRELSLKEVAWVREIRNLGQITGSDDVEHGAGDTPGASHESSLKKRVEMVKKLAQDLLEESKKLEMERSKNELEQSTGLEKGSLTESPSSSPIVSSRLQRAKVADVMALVERETAVIEAVMARLERLSVEY